MMSSVDSRIERWTPLPGTGNGPTLAFQAGAALIFGFLACAMLLGLFLAEKPVILLIAGVLLFIVFFMLAGNQRLFCLWGLLMTAPLSLSKAFWIIPHMGGASAIMIDLCDPFMLALLFFILRDHFRGLRRELRWSPLIYFWGGLAALGAVNLVLGPYRHLALLELIRMAKVYLLFFVIINEVVRARQILHVCYALITGMTIECMIAVVQFVFKADLGLQKLGEPMLEVVKNTTKGVYLGQGDYFRVGALMEHPNVLSAYLAMLLPICIALLFSRVSSFAKAVLGAIVALGVVVLILTLSRSGWLSFAVAFVLLGAISFLHQRLRLRYMLARVAVVIACVIGLGAASGEIIKRLTQSDPGAVSFRYEMMDVAWNMIEERPIFGMGINSFVAALPYYSKYGGPRGITEHFGETWPVVHNTYLIYWSEQGTVGFLLLIGMYGSLLWMGARSGRYMIDDVIYAINLGACCGIVANMVDGIASFFLAENPSERVFFMEAALLVAINYWTFANRKALAPRPVTAQPAFQPGDAVPAAT